jgi:hypothetical protein
MSGSRWSACKRSTPTAVSRSVLGNLASEDAHEPPSRKRPRRATVLARLTSVFGRSVNACRTVWTASVCTKHTDNCQHLVVADLEVVRHRKPAPLSLAPPAALVVSVLAASDLQQGAARTSFPVGCKREFSRVAKPAGSRRRASGFFERAALSLLVVASPSAPLRR